MAVGQPIFTDDLWWHLGLGRAFAAQGPWLAEDPLLFTAPGPPGTAAWLADVVLFEVWNATGFAGLRILHVATVATILALVWSLLRRASASRGLASAGTLAFIALAAYRLVQLRPELFTLAATPPLYRLLIESEAPPSARRIAFGTLLLCVWANVHAGFSLGLAMLGAASAGALVATLLRPPVGSRARAKRLAIALALGAAATLLNPGGSDPHLAWLRAGSETPDLSWVIDEWSRFEPFAWPSANLPPTPLAFALQWALLLATPLAAAAAIRHASRRSAAAGSEPGADPALVAWSLACLLAPFVAVRFLWLGLFPLLLLAQVARRIPTPGRVVCTALFASCALAPAFLFGGDWKMISNLLPRSLDGYAQPYAVAKYYAQPVWFLEDAGIDGNVYIDYALGGFTGFFGAPARRTFSNGSLNLTHDAIEANAAIRERRGERPGESFLALLDRMQVDVFVGTRLPQLNPSRQPRPWFYTTAHLENAPGWLRVFRNLDSAVYLRLGPRSRENLARVAAYYARLQVPFDAEHGFDVALAVRDARGWSVEHGLVPMHFDELVAAETARDPETRRAGAEQLGPLYAALGLYERALRIDQRALRAQPNALQPRRRVVWSLLRLGRFEEAEAEAGPLRAAPPNDPLSHALADLAQQAAAGVDPEAAASQIARLPVLGASEVSQLMPGMLGPELRSGPGAIRR